MNFNSLHFFVFLAVVLLLNQLLAMSRSARQNTSVRLVAWPEVAVPVWLYNHPNYTDSISALARELATPVLAEREHAQRSAPSVPVPAPRPRMVPGVRLVRRVGPP